MLKPADAKERKRIARMFTRACDLSARIHDIRYNIVRSDLLPADKRRLSLSLKRIGELSRQLWALHTRIDR